MVFLSVSGLFLVKLGSHSEWSNDLNEISRVEGGDGVMVVVWR